MTPVPLELPLRPNEAAEIANLIYEMAEGKPLADELRNRLAVRCGALKLESIRPFFGSLARDPVHPSAYYLAVDAAGGPHLLYAAPAAAPSSSIFHQPLLIGRMQRSNAPEFVINAIPFGAGDRENIDRFVAKVDGAFAPKPQGARASITIASEFPAAFEFFRGYLKRTRKNPAALAGDYHAAVWAAIRAGWRMEYTVAAAIEAERTADAVRETLAYTRFSIDVAGRDLKAAEYAHEEIRQARALLKTAGTFDFEVALGEAELAASVEWLRERGHAPQLVSTNGDVRELAAAARQHQVTPSMTWREGAGRDVEALVRETGGRFNLHVGTIAEAEAASKYLL